MGYFKVYLLIFKHKRGFLLSFYFYFNLLNSLILPHIWSLLSHLLVIFLYLLFSIVVWEYTVHDFSSFKCVGICFMAQYIVNFYVFDSALEKNMKSYWLSISYQFRLLILLFKSTIFLVFFSPDNSIIVKNVKNLLYYWRSVSFILWFF